ncbi:MAG TPA: prenyltransferase/squalene oxidase repeat-containing protein [Blastocatellia bacterium]|nr:prenyltransferase/squalene oxidase repeat-containing protein [Blastocatellia bacterium]
MRATVSLIFVLAVSLIWAETAFTGQGGSREVISAIEKSLPLLQRVGPPFIENTGCVSCHHNVLPAMAVAVARERGLKVDEAVARQNATAILEKVAAAREKLLCGVGIPGDATTASYILMGLAASGQAASSDTDAMVHYLLGKQSEDGRWTPVAYRPPLEFSDFTTTALALRAVELYAPQGRAGEVATRRKTASAWLKKTRASNNEELVYRLLGLRWANAERAEIDKAAKGLLASQRSDGGWAQLSGLTSDAYATGQALVALNQAGSVAVTDNAYRRGVDFLLKTQNPDGSWQVESRSIPLQRYFESGFPHKKNQWVSAAGTSWAVMALTLTLPGPQGVQKSFLFD